MVHGHLEISQGDHGVFIGGDPEGLHSLARLLDFLDHVNQDGISRMPDGEREHTHLTPGYQLSKNSIETEVCRLDAKGTGEFPTGYEPALQSTRPGSPCMETGWPTPLVWFRFTF